jgi:hypothetical protein
MSNFHIQTTTGSWTTRRTFCIEPRRTQVVQFRGKIKKLRDAGATRFQRPRGAVVFDGNQLPAERGLLVSTLIGYSSIAVKNGMTRLLSRPDNFSTVRQGNLLVAIQMAVGLRRAGFGWVAKSRPRGSQPEKARCYVPYFEPVVGRFCATVSATSSGVWQGECFRVWCAVRTLSRSARLTFVGRSAKISSRDSCDRLKGNQPTEEKEGPRAKPCSPRDQSAESDAMINPFGSFAPSLAERHFIRLATRWRRRRRRMCGRRSLSPLRCCFCCRCCDCIETQASSRLTVGGGGGGGDDDDDDGSLRSLNWTESRIHLR